MCNLDQLCKIWSQLLQPLSRRVCNKVDIGLTMVNTKICFYGYSAFYKPLNAYHLTKKSVLFNIVQCDYSMLHAADTYNCNIFTYMCMSRKRMSIW